MKTKIVRKQISEETLQQPISSELAQALRIAEQQAKEEQETARMLEEFRAKQNAWYEGQQATEAKQREATNAYIAKLDEKEAMNAITE